MSSGPLKLKPGSAVPAFEEKVTLTKRKLETLMMDAMCLWEAMLDIYQNDKKEKHQMSKIWVDYGAFHMRDLAAGLVTDLNAVWNALDDEMTDNTQFDWEFCPRFVNHVDWGTSAGDMDSNPERIIAEIKAAYALGIYK